MTRLICFPDIVQELHNIFIESEHEGHIKHNSAEARHSSLVKSAKEIYKLASVRKEL